MMTLQQAFRIFVYADWAMLVVGLTAIGVSIGWGIYAILPSSRGRRRRSLQNALIGFLIFAVFWGTQASVLLAFQGVHWSPIRVVLFSLPTVVMCVGLLASVVFGVIAILRKVGTDRRNGVLKSLLGVIVFSAGLAPHTAAMLIPIISAEDHTHSPGTLTKIGEPAPDFDLTAIDGTRFLARDLRGRVVVLNFFATWCGSCRQELPDLQAVWDDFRGNDDFRMLVVGREEPNDTVDAFKRKCGFTFPMAPDPNRSVYDRFASESIPRTYLISREGIILHQWTGNYEEEISKLRKLLSRELATRN